MLSEVCLETARKEAVAPQVGLPLGIDRVLVGDLKLAPTMGKCPFQGGGDGDLMGRTHGGGHWMSHQYPFHWVVDGYPRNKHFQQ